MDEHLLLRETGGTDVTKCLIDHVLEVGQGRNVEIPVLPLSTGTRPGMDGPIVLLETPEHRWLAYSESQEAGQLISDPKTISVLQNRYAKLRSQALTPELARFAGAIARSIMSTRDLAWFKSSYSDSSGDNCIEVALSWHKSSYSSGSGDDCIEIAACPDSVHVRDSKDKEGPRLAFSPTEWTAFVEYASAL